MRRLWGLLASLRTTAWLLVLLSALLLLNVAVPQEAVLGAEAFSALASHGPWNRFFLVTLGLGHLSTSPVFLCALGLFFLNLLAVLADRTGPTLRQVRMRDMSEEQVRRQTAAPTALAVAPTEGWSTADALRLLRGHGFRAMRMGDSAAWGVKNRTAPLGFLLFHASFLLLCAGGALLYYTREVLTARLVEGQAFEAGWGRVVRAAPWTGPGPPAFELLEVRSRFEAGEPTDLSASVRFRYAGGAREATSRVNHPARLGNAALLVEQAGVAPELWLQDDEGFTVDRVSVAATTKGGEPTEVALAQGRFVAVLSPLWPGAGLPSREELAGLPLTLTLREGEAVLFEGTLLPGRSAAAGPLRLQLVRHRFWAGFRVVTERGGGLLISGFLLGVVGLLWRMLAFRREVFLSWEGGVLKAAGRGEFFPGRVRDELESIVRMAAEEMGLGGGPGPDKEVP